MPTSNCCPFTAAIVDALGLHDRKVLSIDLHIAVEDAVTATIVELVADADTGKLVELAGKYEITAIDPGQASWEFVIEQATKGDD